jgi:hypothetical protein
VAAGAGASFGQLPQLQGTAHKLRGGRLPVSGTAAAPWVHGAPGTQCCTAGSLGRRCRRVRPAAVARGRGMRLAPTGREYSWQLARRLPPTPGGACVLLFRLVFSRLPSHFCRRPLRALLRAFWKLRALPNASCGVGPSPYLAPRFTKCQLWRGALSLFSAAPCKFP